MNDVNLFAEDLLLSLTLPLVFLVFFFFLPSSPVLKLAEEMGLISDELQHGICLCFRIYGTLRCIEGTCVLIIYYVFCVCLVRKLIRDWLIFNHTFEAHQIFKSSVYNSITCLMKRCCYSNFDS